MISKKTCKKCGRLLYVNDYCKSCLRELLYERREKYCKEHPNEKFNAEFWKDIDKIQLETRKRSIKESRSLDYNYGISAKLRSKLRNLINNKSNKVQNSYNELIGCSIVNLKSHLESKFTDGMSWANYGLGGWHVDHILPCAVFDLKVPEEQKKCFHYSNLQPMWAKENFDKNAFLKESFASELELNQFIFSHKMPASAKARIRTNKVGKTSYRIIFKYH